MNLQFLTYKAKVFSLNSYVTSWSTLYVLHFFFIFFFKEKRRRKGRKSCGYSISGVADWLLSDMTYAFRYHTNYGPCFSNKMLALVLLNRCSFIISYAIYPVATYSDCSTVGCTRTGRKNKWSPHKCFSQFQRHKVYFRHDVSRYSNKNMMRRKYGRHHQANSSTNVSSTSCLNL